MFDKINKDTTLQSVAMERIEYTIQKNDILKINVSSLNPSEDAIVNRISPSTISAGNSKDGNNGNLYNVDKDGNIIIHRAGKMNVDGMTLSQLSKKIEAALLPFLKDPMVSVEFVNHKVIIMGEVGAPQVIQMPGDEKITLLEALAMTGKLGDNADIKTVLVIRDSANGKQFKHLNLEDHSVFNSPFYYLKKDDIVYFSRDEEKVKFSENRERFPRTLQLVSTAMGSITFLLYIYDRLHR